MKRIGLIGGDIFEQVAYKAFAEVLTDKEKSVSFRFNGVEVLMFKDVGGEKMKGVPKRDGSGKGKRRNKGRSGCASPRRVGKR